MITKLFVYKSASLDPYFNLATEEYLLKNLPESAFILYLWQNENTVVIGRNQNPFAECDIDTVSRGKGKIARRKSGGGAVYHDSGNLNFTFISSTENYDLSQNLEIIKRACARAGIEAELSGRNDITVTGKKFSGNAFYSSEGKALHHGTLLIATDAERLSKYLTPHTSKLSAKGVKSVRSRVVNLSELIPFLTADEMKEHMQSATEEILRLEAERLPDIPASKLSPLCSFYSDKSWIFGKTPPFTARFEGRCGFGSAELLLSVERSIIKSAHLFTDSLDTTLSDRAENALVGVPFDFDSIRAALPSDISEELLSIMVL